MTDLFRYTEYRDFLNDYLASQPKQGWGLLGKWASHLGVDSSFISQVLKGKKELSLDHLYSLAKLLKLNETERKYLVFLGEAARAGTQDLRNVFLAEAERLRKTKNKASSLVQNDIVLSDADQAIYYSSWCYSAIRIFCGVGEGKTKEEIQHRFPQLENKKVVSVMQFLLRTRLCERGRDARMIMGPAVVVVDRNSPHFSKHHSHWRLKSIEKLDHLAPSEVMLTVPLSISRRGFDQLSAKVRNLLKQALEEIRNEAPDEVACLNLDLFWLSGNVDGCP